MNLAGAMLSKPASPGNVDTRPCIKSTHEPGFEIFPRALVARRLSMIFPNKSWSGWQQEGLIGSGFWACGKRDLQAEKSRVHTSNGRPNSARFLAISAKKMFADPALP